MPALLSLPLPTTLPPTLTTTNNRQPRGVLTIGNHGVANNGQPRGIAPTKLGGIVHRYETLTTKRHIDGVKNKNWQRFNGKLWQRNYWEHIIRNENEYQHISEYIINNPLKWEMDELNGGDGNRVIESQTQYTVGAAPVPVLLPVVAQKMITQKTRHR